MFVAPLNSDMFPKDIREFGLRFKHCDVHSHCGHFIASAHSQNVPSNRTMSSSEEKPKKTAFSRFRYDPYKQNRKQHIICLSLTKQKILLPYIPKGITPILGL